MTAVGSVRPYSDGSPGSASRRTKVTLATAPVMPISSARQSNKETIFFMEVSPFSVDFMKNQASRRFSR